MVAASILAIWLK